MSGSVASSGPPELDKYELLEEIGHGGMATVYRARDLRLDREVAIKVIHKHLRENPEVRRRFGSEARAVAKLRHPCIVDVYDVSDEDDIERFLVVELVLGTTLRELLRQRGALPAEVAAAIVARLCEAIEHAHGCGVIHRDIKPENVLIDACGGASSRPVAAASQGGASSGERESSPTAAAADSGPDAVRRTSDGNGPQVKLTDFGIAKILDTKGVTSTGQILGSPAHMAPEQIEGGDVGPATDVFALGVLLYECCVGHLPFEGKNPAQVLRHVLDGDFDPADTERPQVGGRWARIIAQALHRDVTERLGSAAEMAELCRAELDALGITDAEAELAAFFADPEPYEAELAERLVPRLLERGEAARRAGLINDAAADFNRALAFRPSDLAILKRVSALTAQSLWRRRTMRLLTIAAGSIVLGLGAYGTTRWLRPEGAGRPAAPVFATWLPSIGGSASAEPSAEPLGPDQVDPTPTSRPVVSWSGLGSADRPHVELPTDPRKARVRFSLIPKGANLVLDGTDHGTAFGRVFELEVGSHAVGITLPPGSKCCKPRNTTVVIKAPPEDDPDKVQLKIVMAEPKPCTVTLVGAPAGGRFSCPTIGLGGAAGAPQTVTLPSPLWTGSCSFSPSGRKASVVLRAGEGNAIPWPGG